KALMKGKNLDKKLLEGKLLVFRKLYEKGVFEKEKLLAVLRFLDKYILFEELETNRIFKAEIDKITGKRNTMDILEELVAEPRVRKKVREIVKSLLTETSLSVEEIAKSTKESVSFVNRVKKSL